MTQRNKAWTQNSRRSEIFQRSEAEFEWKEQGFYSEVQSDWNKDEKPKDVKVENDVGEDDSVEEKEGGGEIDDENETKVVEK